MIAMVMCAGLGTRLRPLTYLLPKPIVPVANKPVLEHTLNNLRKHGIKEVVINLSYQPEAIRSYFQDGSKWDMKIHYSVEKKLLGTAGGVKNVEKIFRADSDPDFLVTSGDGLTDINFTNLIRFHRQRKALGTMALSKVDSRFEYGVTLTDPRGRIRRFIEKPFWSDIFSNRVNTGIYVFQKEIFNGIPANQFYDFGKQLWPAMLRQKKNIYGFEFNEFWTDIGNTTEYRRAQQAVLDKQVRVKVDAKEIRANVWVEEGSQVDDSVALSSPCMIGKYCKIQKNATIGAYTIIGHRTKVSSKAVLKNSILWNDVEVASKVHLEDCIIGNQGKVTESISVFEGTIFDVHKI